ncbi:MAG: exo-alpha-sialidase, partial [Aeoliella sp.]
MSHTFVTHSDDDGLSWSIPRDVTHTTKRVKVNSTATGPGIGIVLTRGEHKGRIIMPTNEGWFEGKNRFFNVYACYSDDHGETWKNGETAPNGSPGNGNEVQMVELSDGSIQLNSRSNAGSRLRKLAVSNDGGATWSPLKDHQQLPEPQCMGSVLRYSFPEEGKSRILYAGPGTKRGRSQGTVRISYDEGKTWPVAKMVDPDGYAYSCLTKLPNGDVGLLYEANGYKQIRFMRLPLAALEHQGRRIKVACIGDSITFGAGIRNRDRQSYPARLQQMLGDGYHVQNFGRSGADVLNINNGPYVKTEQHRAALAFQPDIVVCNLGINDHALVESNQQAFVSDYTNLFQQYSSLASKPKLFLWTDLAPVMRGQTNYQQCLGLQSTYAQLLREVAKKVQGKGIDMHSPLANHPEWFPDHLHPNARGAIRIAATTADVLAPNRPRIALTAFKTARAADQPGGFEQARAGQLSTVATPLGEWSAEQGHAEIDNRHAHSGRQCLHLHGGKDRQVQLAPKLASDQAKILTFWAERWTRRTPFEFRVEQQVADKWVEIYNGDRKIRVGGFLTHVHVPLTDGIPQRVRFRSTTPSNSGVLIDDVSLQAAGPLKVSSITADQPVLPALVGTEASAVCRIRIDVSGFTGTAPMVQSLSLSTKGTTDLADVENVGVFYTGSLALANARGTANAFAGATSFGNLSTPKESIVVNGEQQLAPGANYFWITFQLKANANIDHRLRAEPEYLTIAGGAPQKIEHQLPATGLRMGRAVRRRGDDGVHTYRIPGLATTNQGTLIGVYDVRRRSGGDLPGDIDVGMSRSTDGGQTWEPMQVIMNMGNDPNWRYDGIGDPTVMVDRKTGTIWVAATWSHGNRSWFGSGPGLKPAETGQFMLVRSDDDGKSWSDPINITPQVKQPEWCFLLQGPGKGFTMSDGTLLLPAQYQDTPENNRLPRSTFIYSRDHGESWTCASGAFDDTTEAQVVELPSGELMINCRYNREPYRVVMTTNNLGKSWQVHQSSRQALIEPGACMASLIHADHESGTDLGGWL